MSALHSTLSRAHDGMQYTACPMVGQSVVVVLSATSMSALYPVASRAHDGLCPVSRLLMSSRLSW